MPCFYTPLVPFILGFVGTPNHSSFTPPKTVVRTQVFLVTIGYFPSKGSGAVCWHVSSGGVECAETGRQVSAGLLQANQTHCHWSASHLYTNNFGFMLYSGTILTAM